MTLHQYAVSNLRDLRSDYTLHAAIEAATEGSQRRALWRRDGSIVTIDEPLSPVNRGWELTRVRANPAVAAGDRAHIDAWLNPTVGRNGKRFALAGTAARVEWARRQAAKAGIDVETASVRGARPVTGRKGDSDLTLVGVRFQLTGVVADAEALGLALVNGVGPGKAFGLGLLIITQIPGGEDS